MARILAALGSALFFFVLTLIIGHSLAAAVLATVITFFIMFFALCILEMAHINEEASQRYRKTH